MLSRRVLSGRRSCEGGRVVSLRYAIMWPEPRQGARSHVAKVRDCPPPTSAPSDNPPLALRRRHRRLSPVTRPRACQRATLREIWLRGRGVCAGCERATGFFVSWVRKTLTFSPLLNVGRTGFFIVTGAKKRWRAGGLAGWKAGKHCLFRRTTFEPQKFLFSLGNSRRPSSPGSYRPSPTKWFRHDALVGS